MSFSLRSIFAVKTSSDPEKGLSALEVKNRLLIEWQTVTASEDISCFFKKIRVKLCDGRNRSTFGLCAQDSSKAADILRNSSSSSMTENCSSSSILRKKTLIFSVVFS